MSNPKIFILGLDSLPPFVLYGKEDYGLTYIKHTIVRESLQYTLLSCHPPITVPAWMVMFTGKSPGELGIYGFRHRRPGEFNYYIINSRYVKAKALWDNLSRESRVVLYGVPPTYPPKPIRGLVVTDFTTPDPSKPYTFPPSLRRELERTTGHPVFDIKYRRHDKESVMRDLFHMLDTHLRQVEYIALNKKWDLFIYVEISVDRAHHAFWRFFDRSHPKYSYHEKYSNVIPNLYRTIDRWFEKLHKRLPRDTIIVVASDHGIKSMKGAFAINQWLIEQEYLKLKQYPKEPGSDLEEDTIDWNNTIAWAWGGYYSRVFINLKDREKHGIVEKKYYEETIKELKSAIKSIKGPTGEYWQNSVYTPNELYSVVRGDPPDLLVYLDDLNWRAAGTIGWSSQFLEENDRGPDDAVHDWKGVFLVYDPEERLDKKYMGFIDIAKVKDYLLEFLARQ